MDLNIITITYLFLRLAPFVLIYFFLLSSFLNQDIRGIIYLVGLFFSCFITIIAESNLSLFVQNLNNGKKSEKCNILSINQNDYFSKLPFGQTVFGFTFFYLLFPICMQHKENYIKYNIPIIVFFPLLILFDMIWNKQNTCYENWQLLASLALGAGFGTLWALLVSLTYNPSFQYLITDTTNENNCKTPSNQTFKCNYRKRKQ